ncbi:MAG: tryptophanase [Candidatus Izemoplasmatales bacterium]
MEQIKLFSGQALPLEMHKVRIVEKLNLIPVEERAKAMIEAGCNTFLLRNKDVFMDMLTDSGVNAMSQNQQAAMLAADDSYAGSESFYRFESKIQELFGMNFVLPAHQGRACENILSQVYVKDGQFVPMNYHFTTTKAHIQLNGGTVVELMTEEGLKINSDEMFKGNMDTNALAKFIKDKGPENIAFVRMEAGTNLIGGQPFSLKNLEEVSNLCHHSNILLVLDASLLSDNLYFIKKREEDFKNQSIRQITKKIANLCDIIYFSARKLGSARGGAIVVRKQEDYDRMKGLITLYEGFLTYGGMSVREIEAITIGLEETMDENMINQGPQFIEYMTNELLKAGVPVVTPAGGLGCHINAKDFLPHIPQEQYPAGALAAALYVTGGIRGMERGTLSEERQSDGSETLANMELVRIALPRRVFTLSQVKYVIDRIIWLFYHRELVQGLVFELEPEILRFFFGRLTTISPWIEDLVKKFREDFGDSL